MQEPVYFITAVPNRKVPGKNIKLAVAFDGDKVIYCKGRLRKKFIFQFETRQERSQYMWNLIHRSGIDNMVACRFDGELV